MENEPLSQAENTYHFLLFVSGMSIRSVHAIENLRALCGTYLNGNYKLEIIDIGRHKEQARKHQIVAVPTLIKTRPNGRRIIIGDLSDTQKVVDLLGFNE